MHEPEPNERITEACTLQRTIHNIVGEQLLTHRSDEPLQRNHREGTTGLARLAWAIKLVRLYDTVCVEKLKARNMTRSTKGTNDAPGTGVKRKQGLNRSLMGIAPATQTRVIERAAEKRGTQVIPDRAPRSGQDETHQGTASRRTPARRR